MHTHRHQRNGTLPFTCIGGSRVIVLRARWIFGGSDKVEGEEHDGSADGRTGLLLIGPETLIFARPGDSATDVEGEEDNKEEVGKCMDLAAYPVRERSDLAQRDINGRNCGHSEAKYHLEVAYEQGRTCHPLHLWVHPFQAAENSTPVLHHRLVLFLWQRHAW